MGNWKKKRGNIGPNKQRRYNRRTGKTENFNERNKRIEANLPKKADTETDEDLSPEMARQEERKKYPSRGFIPEVRERTFPLLYVPRHGIGAEKSAIVGASSSRTTWLR